MKYIVILGDGMADVPYEALGGKTPLEVASKPNIDSLAQKSICGMCKTVPDGMKPGSDVANLSVMGYSPLKYYSGRSPLEALSIGVDMADDDLAIRCNLVTLSDEEDYAQKSMVDYSAGEISSSEAAELIAAVQEALGNDTFAFFSGVSYRHCLIRHHGECGTEFTPPHDISGKVISDYLPSGLYGEEMLSLMKASYDILKDHPINLKRMEEGKNPANSIWLWGEGSKPILPQFESMRGLKAAVISAVDLLKGIGIAGGMKVIEVEGATGTVKTNFAGKAKACVQAIRDGYDYVYLHMEAPDECGHQGDHEGKVKSIELIDKEVVGYILNELKGEDLRILVCPDHPTPLATKTHSSEPIPFLIFDSTCIKEGVSAYTENECKTTDLLLQTGDELVDLFLNKDEDMKEENIEDGIILSEQNDEDTQTQQEQEIDSEASESLSEVDVKEEQDIIEEDTSVDNASDLAEEGADEAEQLEEPNDGEQAQEVAESEEQTNEEQSAQEEKSDEDEQKIEGSEIFATSDNGDKNSAKIDPKSQSEDKKEGKEKKEKKKMSPKQKKIVTILIAIAVCAVIITAAILTPILVINAPKVLIGSAEDFAKPVKNNKELYYLKNDVTYGGDLTLGLNLDLNKYTLTVNGTLTIDSPKGGTLLVGNKDGKEYVAGGSIIAKKLVIKNAKKVNVLSNITADEVQFNQVAEGTFQGSIMAKDDFAITSSKLTLNELAFGEAIEKINVVNSALTLNKSTKIAVNLENNCQVKVLSDVGNVTLDDTSELRLYGNVYAKASGDVLGTITGGKVVYISDNSKVAKVQNVNELWITRDFEGEVWNSNVHYIAWLETPQFVMLSREGVSVHLGLSSIDKRAKEVRVNIDGAADDVVFDIATDNISTSGGYEFDLGERLNVVGKHNIKVVLRSENPEFVRDSDPYFTEHTHYITLDKVSAPRVEKDVDGDYWLKFGAVNFAENYEVVFDGIMINIVNGNNKPGDEISHNLSADSKFTELLKVTGNHSITIVAKSDQEGINPSEKAYAKFDAITQKLESPVLTINQSSDSTNWIFTWNAVDNASGYIIELSGVDVENITIRTSKLEILIAVEDLAGYNIASITAVGKSVYYENSDSYTTTFGAVAPIA